jgi:hypothetical protein
VINDGQNWEIYRVIVYCVSLYSLHLADNNGRLPVNFFLSLDLCVQMHIFKTTGDMTFLSVFLNFEYTV